MKEIIISPDDISPEVLDARDRVNAYSENRIGELMEDYSHERTLLNDEIVRFGLIQNGDELDTTKLIVMPHPFANGWETHMLLRGMMLQKALKVDHPVVALPNPRPGYQPYKLNETEMSRLNEGFFKPIADRHAAIIEHVQAMFKTESEVFIDGYSQGAAVGAVLSGLVETDSAFLAEAPNTTTRTKNGHNAEVRALSRAFRRGGLAPLSQAVVDSAMPALLEAQGVSPGKQLNQKQISNLARFTIGTFKPENRANKNAMAHPRFSGDLLRSMESNPNMRVHLARAAGSLILTEQQQEAVAMALDGSTNVVYQVLQGSDGYEYGHVAGDNLLVHAEGFRLAAQR